VIPDQRRALMLQKIQTAKLLSVRQLVDMLDVSHMTVRRDITILESEGHVVAVPGGVKLVTHLASEPGRSTKAVLHSEQKLAIATAAAHLIGQDEVIYLDAGTTTQAMVPLLLDRGNLTIVTNDFGVVDALEPSDIPTIHIGGFVDHANRSTVGSLATLVVKELNISTAFISASSWSLRRGVTTPSAGKVDVKHAVLANAGRSILMADSSKYGSFSAFSVAPLASFAAVVSDAELGESVAASIRAAGIRLDLVSPASVGDQTGGTTPRA
jgi:DeoR/GlpR family transcriptional regulator of sugar metabolism